MYRLPANGSESVGTLQHTFDTPYFELKRVNIFFRAAAVFIANVLFHVNEWMPKSTSTTTLNEHYLYIMHLIRKSLSSFRVFTFSFDKSLCNFVRFKYASTRIKSNQIIRWWATAYVVDIYVIMCVFVWCERALQWYSIFQMKWQIVIVAIRIVNFEI